MPARLVLSLLLLFIQCVMPMAYAETNNTPQNLTATIKVKATPLYFHFGFNSRGNPIPQSTNIDYSITYGSLVSYDAPITLTASWSRGTLEGNSSETIDVVTYADGSAGKAYGNTTPIIDTIHRTITWNISSLPANLPDQTVHFSLRTFDANYDQVPIKFSVTANMTADTDVVMPQKTIEGKYLFDPTLVTPTITPPPVSDLPTPTLTPKAQAILQFSSIDIQTLSSDQATIAIKTTLPTAKTILYGLSPISLTEKIEALSPSITQLITLPHLTAHTQYYFQVQTQDTRGKIYTSNLYTFTTASISQAPAVQASTVIITSDNKLMSTQFDTVDQTHTLIPSVLLPTYTPYEIQFAFEPKQTIKTAQIIARSTVLGDMYSAIPHAFAAPDSVDMVEIRPHVFLARAGTPSQTGLYELFVKSTDTNGNITEQKVASLHVTNPLTVTDEHNTPLENARVLLFVYKQSLGTYETVGNHSIKNPTFTNLLGENSLILPPGKYKAHVTALGYLPKDVTFTIGHNDSDGYPTVQLTGDTYNVINFIYYMSDTTSDIWGNFIASMQSFAASSRVFDLTTIILLWTFVMTTFLSFSLKTHTHPKAGISQLVFMLHHLFDRHAKKQYLLGTVIDKKLHAPLSKTRVFVIDDNTKNVLFETITNKKGSFLLKKPLIQYHLMAVKEGYEAAIMYPNSSDVLYITLHANTYQMAIKAATWHTIHRIFSMLFETLMAFSLITELFLTQVFGIEKTWPFVALSILNILLWFYYLSLKHSKYI